MSDIKDQIETKTVYFYCHQLPTINTFCSFEVIVVFIWIVTFYISFKKNKKRRVDLSARKVYWGIFQGCVTHRDSKEEPEYS